MYPKKIYQQMCYAKLEGVSMCKIWKRWVYDNFIQATYTIAETFEQICKRKAPWVAIGDFLNDWQCYAIEQREELIKTPLCVPSHLVMVRWAAFCAAMVEWLCYQDNIQWPDWVKQECYVLPNPWFFYRRWDTRSWLLATTPAPFKMHNIFCGDRVILNKWNVVKVAEK